MVDEKTGLLLILGLQQKNWQDQQRQIAQRNQKSIDKLKEENRQLRKQIHELTPYKKRWSDTDKVLQERSDSLNRYKLTEIIARTASARLET